ncbi:MAG: hypothetical protein IKB32_01135 [Clostridia bacterium]|nr:hypothetical protein [Clostridia bacterium]
MKEKIYTIPINESLDADCSCPFCFLERKLECEAIDYTLGAAMMEPDFRMITNEKGFCKTHIKRLIEKRNALSLALIMDTHLAEIKSLFELENNEKSFFKKKKADNPFVSAVAHVAGECAVCSKINHTLDRYFYTFIFMLKSEKGFLDKVLSKNGFCFEHFAKLTEFAFRELSDREIEKYFKPIIELEENKIAEYHEHIKKFADSFDYRNAGKKCDVPKDILTKTAEFLNGEIGD